MTARQGVMMDYAKRNMSGLRRGGGRNGPNKKALRAFGESLLKSKTYRKNLYARIMTGKAPHMELYLSQMAYGKPTEHVAVSGGLTLVDPSKLSDAQLEKMADLVQQAQAIVGVPSPDAPSQLMPYVPPPAEESPDPAAPANVSNFAEMAEAAHAQVAVAHLGATEDEDA